MKKKITLHIVIQLILFVLLTAIDQFTKYLAVINLKEQDPHVLIEGTLEFRYLENSGAAFSMFQNRQWLFYVITAVIMAVLIWLYVRVSRSLYQYTGVEERCFRKKTFSQGILLNYILTLLAAGAIGNLIDRVRLQYVVDFIYFKLIDFPVFNFADICVTISAILLIVYFLFIYKEDINFPLFTDKRK